MLRRGLVGALAAAMVPQPSPSGATYSAAAFGNGVLLTSDSRWSVALGQSFLQSDGADWDKITTSAGPNLVVEDNGLESFQEIACKIGTAFQIGPMCMASNTGGLTGYALGLISGTALRLSRWVGGSAQQLIASMTVVGSEVFKLKCEIVGGNPVLTVFANGVQIGTYTDTNVAKLLTGKKGIGVNTVSIGQAYAGQIITTNYVAP